MEKKPAFEKEKIEGEALRSVEKHLRGTGGRGVKLLST